ncbi:hypothetical protein BJ165DRAFT_1407750 [Panaeolus papilionaceus]|nr:hypothetical protein BJ165DRAFT_1407750 [Panaeolus papilionaceus]
MTSLCFTIAYIVGKGAQSLYSYVKQKREEKKKRKAETGTEQQIGDRSGRHVQNGNAYGSGSTEQATRPSNPEANLGLSPEGRACISAMPERRILRRSCSPSSRFESLDGAVQHINNIEPAHAHPGTPFGRFLQRSGVDTLVDEHYSKADTQLLSHHPDPPPQYESTSRTSAPLLSSACNVRGSQSDPQLPPYRPHDVPRERSESEQQPRRATSFSNSSRSLSPASLRSVASIAPKPFLSACRRHKDRNEARERFRAARCASFLSSHEGDPESVRVEAAFGQASVPTIGLTRRNAIRKRRNHTSTPPPYATAPDLTYA